MQSEHNEIATSHAAPRCPTCNSDLSMPGLDLGSAQSPPWTSHETWKVWYIGAEHNCAFCRTIVAVIEHAQKTFECNIRWMRMQLKATAGTQYSLYLKDIIMPSALQSSDEYVRYLGDIAIHLQKPIRQIPLTIDQPIAQQAADDTCVDLARNWLSACRDGHDECNNTYDSLKPSRLLDIRGNVVKLILQTENPTTAPYVALSHCWGNAQPLRTLLTNIGSFQQNIPLKSLPQTFSDAIYIARALDFQYLWIDSLCIIQDSIVDWVDQSSMMASIYSNADLVLGASAASSASEGFLEHRHRYHEGNVTLQVNKYQTAFGYRFLHSHDDAEEPLDRRGWALQERLCARRFLSYGKYEMLWECKGSLCCECARPIAKPGAPSGNFQAELDNTIPEDLGQCWRRSVAEPYSRRILTRHNDIPVAISALAARFQSRFNGRYLAGLWKEDLVRDLLWYGTSEKCVTSFFAPSWSWMSLEANAGLSFFSDSLYRPTRQLVEILKAITTPSTVNQFGPVSSGSITLAGVLIPDYTLLTISGFLESPHDGGGTVQGWIDVPLVRVDVQLDDGSQTTTTRRAFRHEQNTETSCSMILLPLLYREYIRWCAGLVLGRSTSHPGAFERLGVFYTLTLKAFEDAKRNHGVREIVLV